MAINPIQLNATISRSQDLTIIKQNEDNKAMHTQVNLQGNMTKEIDQRLNQVRTADNANNDQKEYDAKGKGKGEYSGDGGKRRKKEEDQDKNGKVIVKGSGGFDMKV